MNILKTNLRSGVCLAAMLVHGKFSGLDVSVLAIQRQQSIQRGKQIWDMVEKHAADADASKTINDGRSDGGPEL